MLNKITYGQSKAALAAFIAFSTSAGPAR